MSRFDNNAEEYNLELMDTTALAILVVSEHGNNVWLPRSVIKDFVDHDDGTCTFTVSDEIATEKELI